MDITEIQHLWEAGSGYSFWENTRSRWKIPGGVKSFDMSEKAKLKQITVTRQGADRSSLTT